MAELRHRPEVVIVGGGFAGLDCARGLRNAPVQVTLVDRRNFHLFQPLLYQVATGGLSPANIAAPLRAIVRDHRNVRTLMAEVSGFDLPARRVILSDGGQLPFDYLVIATGSTHHYFGNDHWEQFAPGLKTIEDATRIRSRVLTAFERAERETDFQARKRLLTFVVIGGGPTGVEMAGAISELARHTLRRDFRNFDPATARILLIESSDRVLTAYPERLSEKAADALRTMGVEVWTGARVIDLQPDSVQVRHGTTESSIECATIIWAAGVKASPLGASLAEAIGGGFQLDRGGRVPVTADCSVPGHPELFVIGDLAAMPGPDGQLLPGLAPVAKQQGQYVAEVIARRVRGEPQPRPFDYRDRGTMATIGRARAVANLYWIQISGMIAWLAWLFIHIIYLTDFSNRMLVLFQWFWNYVTRNRSARLITGEFSDSAARAGRTVPAAADLSPTQPLEVAGNRAGVSLTPVMRDSAPAIASGRSPAATSGSELSPATLDGESSVTEIARQEST